MNWNEVKKLYPDRRVKVKIINSHTDNDYLYIDEMKVIKTIDSDKATTLELTKDTGNNLVFHTSHDTIRTKLIKSLGLFRRIPG